MSGLAARRFGGLMATALFLTAQPPNRPTAQDPAPILDRASQSYDTVRTLQADFVQVVDNPMIGDPDTTRGRLYQRRPGYFAMRFTEPKDDRIVADGRHLWLYTPSTTPGQVIRSAIPGTGTTGPNLIGQFVERPRERYTARYVRIDIVETSGQRRTIILQNLAVNRAIAAREFRFSPTSGVRVVDQ